MKKTIILIGLLSLILTSCGVQSPIKGSNDKSSLGVELTKDSIYMERMEVINSLFRNKKGAFNPSTGTYDNPKISKFFFQFRGLSAIIWNPKFVDNLMGHCVNYEKEEIYSFSEIFTTEELSRLIEQIGFFHVYEIIDEKLIDDSINIVDSHDAPAITLPLIINEKAIVYLTNKYNYEVLLVLVKKKGKWVVRCRKVLYNVITD